jgi:hypothetical protein
MNYLAPVYNFLSGVNQLPYNNIKIILKVNTRPARSPKWNFDVLIRKRISSNEPAG